MIDNPEVVAAAVAFVVTFLDPLRRWYRNEDVKLYELPWLEFRTLFEYARRRTFTIERPDRPSFVVEMGLEEYKETLAKQGFKPRHPFSFVYDGETSNMVRYRYDPEKKHPHRQIHPRTFPHVDGVEVMAHEEPHWYLHPVAHLRSRDIEYEAANEFVKERLDSPAQLDYPAE